MDCGINFIKYLLFIFNFIFTLCGLALMIVGILIHLQMNHVSKVLDDGAAYPTIGLIVLGAIIFTIAFFGCCGAIRESHCMIVTFAVLLLTILVIQVALAIYIFVNIKENGDNIVRGPFTKIFQKYYTNQDDREIIDFFQSNLQCCGIDSYKDYQNIDGTNNTIPWSCCESGNEKDKKPCYSNFYQDGCVGKTAEFLRYAGKVLGGVPIGIAVVEFIGIIFALCLANSIRNADRRGYRV